MAPCPLCLTPSVFPGPGPLLAALSSLTRGPILCPLPLCGHTAASLDSLILHLACHSDNLSATQQHQPQQHQQHQSDNSPVFQQNQQQLESDNIDQVIKDLEDLVGSEREPPGLAVTSPPQMVTQPPPAWSCPTPDSGLGSQLQSPQGSHINLPGPGYQGFMSGQPFHLNSINLQGLSNQVSASSVSSLLSAPPPHPASVGLIQYRGSGPEVGPHSDHSQAQAQLRGKLVSVSRNLNWDADHGTLGGQCSVKMLKCSHCVSDGPGSRPAGRLTSAQKPSLQETCGLRGHWRSQSSSVIWASGVCGVRLDV